MCGTTLSPEPTFVACWFRACCCCSLPPPVPPPEVLFIIVLLFSFSCKMNFLEKKNTETQKISLGFIRYPKYTFFVLPAFLSSDSCFLFILSYRLVGVVVTI